MYLKRLISALLSLSMLASTIPSAFARASDESEGSYFDFEASEYEVNEKDGEIKIKIVRHGQGNEAVDVAFKAADFLSDYGVDYDILDDYGDSLEKIYGEKPDMSDFVYEGDEDAATDDMIEKKHAGAAEDVDFSEEEIDLDNVILDEADEITDLSEITLDSEEEISDTEDEDSVMETDESTVPEINNDVPKKRKSTGSPLRDAQAEYLNLPENTEKTESAIKDTLNDLYSYFLSAEGAEGTVHFGRGDTEKTITIRIFDNDIAEQNKLFMLALIGTNADNTTIAANATTYVTIVDDEEAEIAYFDLDDAGLVLTSDAPEGYVTVKRSGASQYFATVFVSTVKDTADDGAYESFEYKTVAFVPGETEKKVKVTAYDFSEDSKFGIRLEGESGVEIGNHYIDVAISSGNINDTAADAALMGDTDADIAETDEDVSLMASNVKLGSSSWSANFSNTDVPGGWKTEVTGDGKAWKENNRLKVKNYDKNKHSMWVTNSKINLIGNKNITFSAYVTNVSRGFNTKYDTYSTYFETDSDQTFEGSLNNITINGNKNWKEYTMSLNNSGDSAYLKFSTKPTSNGYDNPQAELDWIRFNYAYYTFSAQNSVESFNRRLYDFTQGTPNIYDTYWDGETNRIYNPGGIVIKKKSNSDTVAGFYGNNSDSITITSANETKNKNRGIYLKGVYFVNNGISDHTLYSNGKYTTSKVYYAAASNGSVTVTPNQNFIKTLRDKGVISDVHSDATIKVYPVFAQEEVIVCFENTDRDDSKSATRGKFDSNNKASYIVNILEANKNGKVGKYQTGGWLDYYYIYVPKYSVIRVQTQPISTRVAAGVSYWYWGSNEQRTYYRSGDTKFSGTTPSGEKITQTDYTKADIVASNDVSMRPATGEQTFDIRYFPKANIPDEYTGANGLTNAVLLSDVDSNQVIGADKSGKYTFRNPFVGMSWSLTAVAPDGYYTQWVNMTGDTNGDGYISDSEGKAIKNKSATFPDEVYGNKISGQLDQDNFKLYYYFLPKTGGNGANKTGVVTRAPENFYQLANRIKSSSKATPVVGAYVDVGGFIGMTDGKGEYSIECKDLPIAGNVSTTINADGSTTYHTISKLQRHTPIELPALSKFNAVSISASYDKDGKINSDWITVKDDKLTISATVSSESAITPKKARFFIYDDSDNEIKTLDGADGYTVSTKTSGNNFTASLTFNPTKDMKWGYKIYAQFADQNDEWTNVIDLGYYFSSQLNLAEFVFPLIGSSSLEDTIRTGFVADIIGDPLGDTSIGSINKFETKDYKYTPAQIDEQYKQDYTWQRTDYSFGWSDTFYRKETTTSKESDEKKLLAYLKSIYDGKSGGKAPPTPSKFSTKSKFRWEITPSVGFNLTLSSRKDKYVYFEDLVFYVKADFNVMANQAIQLPIGISVLVQGELKGNIAGIYHMYVDYKDKYETEDAVRYTSENFGIFKKFNNSVRREGYIFLDPTVAVKLGIGVGIVFVTGNANFIFDMDFRFTEGGTDTYGDITIDLGWGIQLVGFEVYAKSLYDVTYKLFNSSGQNGHINFDYAAANNLALMSAAEYFETDGDEKLTLDKPVSRDYLNNRSRWLGEDDEMILAAYDVSEGTIENTLRNGTTESPYVRMMELDNGEILMVFIDDDESRSNVNKRALYYSVYNGSGWSQPVLADNDGTPDDYPTLCDLGDGRIFVAWSSAERILPDNATVEDVLKAMNIKASFFDKQTKQMGEVMQITKTTDKDYTADVMPGAAYDSTTDRLILYYTKTEYDGLEKLTDISDAYSVNAYMFYENGKWSDADDYEADELDGVENPEEYKKNWYGQRFLDLRINTDSDNMPRVADTASISCNGLGLFAWTVDWDTNLETNNDRDVFMQIYNFDENSFTHIIRVTPETSVYTTPKFERSDNGTYLFYGASTADESEGSVHSEIKYLNISDLIKNDRFTKISEAGNNEYYIFRYTREAYTTEDPDGNVVENPAEDIIVTADTAVVCNNAVDYDVKVSKDGQMFLFWTDTVNEARQIMVSAYNGADADDDDEENDQNKENADSSESFWSEPVVLTDAEADEYYSGLGAAVVDGTLIAASAKGNYNDTSTSSLVWQKHTPFSKVRTTGIRFDSEYPYPLASTDLIATVKNEGLAPRYVSDEPVTVTFTINGKIAGTADVISTIPGGKSVDVICSVELPEDISNLEIGAYIEESDSVSAKLETNSDIELENNTIELYKDNDGCRVAYSATMRNNGNAAIDNTVFTAMTGETEIGNLTIELLEANDEQNIDITLDIPDSAYTINNDGVGYAEISINAVSGDKTVAYYNGRAEKVFSAEAIALLDSVTEIVFKNDGTYKMKSGDKEDIQPEFGGIDPGDLIVQWIDSSDSNAAYIDYDNMIIAQNKGTTTITGIVVPNEERIEFDVNGNAQKVDWETLIPKDKMVKVTAVINVSETKRSGSKGGSGGTVSANLTETPAPTTDPKATSEPEITTDPKATSEPEITTDPKATSEPQPAPTSSTSNLQFDDTADHWAKDYIERLSANGMVNGMADRIFEPNGSVTRAQFAQILMKTGIVSAGNITVPSFTDVDPDAWYYEAVTWAVSCGIANGMSDEIFEPESNITREQMAAMINRFIKLAGIEAETVKEIAFIDADSISDWARADIEALATMGIVSGRDTGEFAPHANMTRAESAVVICNILDVKGV